MPANWSSPIPQWNLNLLNLPNRHHPPPAPASSSYSPPPTARSEALRTPSGFFARFATPRLGHRPAEAPDIPPVPVQLGAGYSPNHVYEAGPGRRSDGTDSVVEDMNVPEPLFGATATTQQRGINASGSRPALQPPAPIHPSSANNTTGDLPITFSPSEINTPNIPPQQPDPTSSTRANPPSRSRRHRHRRHRAAHHRLNSSASASSTLSKPKSAFRDPEIKTKLLHTVISGLLVLLTIIIFLALSPQTPVFSPPFRVVNSLLIVFFAIIFVHSFIRLQSLIFAFRRRQRKVARKNREADAGHGSADYGRGMSVNANGGRVQYFDDPEIGLPPPGEPIRVVLARDEEIGVNDDLVAEDGVRPDGVHARPVPEMAESSRARQGSEARVQGTPKLPPPVYGVWRGSVRADPNLLHWQRVERPARGGSRSRSGSESEDESEGDVEHSRPPPSYVTQEMREQGQSQGQGHVHAGLQTLPATRYVI